MSERGYWRTRGFNYRDETIEGKNGGEDKDNVLKVKQRRSLPSPPPALLHGLSFLFNPHFFPSFLTTNLLFLLLSFRLLSFLSTAINLLNLLLFCLHLPFLCPTPSLPLMFSVPSHFHSPSAFPFSFLIILFCLCPFHTEGSFSPYSSFTFLPENSPFTSLCHHFPSFILCSFPAPILLKPILLFLFLKPFLSSLFHIFSASSPL